jgi:acetyl-CoA carboxylase carboxyltransferase component
VLGLGVVVFARSTFERRYNYFTTVHDPFLFYLTLVPFTMQRCSSCLSPLRLAGALRRRRFTSLPEPAPLASLLDARSEEWAQNAAVMRAHVAQLRANLDAVRAGGGAKAMERHVSRGKLAPRDRVALLLDPGTPFLELAPLAGWELYEDAVPSGGIIAGIGRVNGIEVMVVANDATVKGGTYYPITVKKHLRAQEIAAANALPCVYLVDSGGAFLPRQDEVFPDKDHFGRIFFNQANMSAAGVPQIAAVLGSCTAGGAYVPAMCDESIIVKGQGTIFLGGPPLVKAATGEVVSAEDLGGADVHCRSSGVTDHLAEDDRHAIAIARRCVANLNRRGTPPSAAFDEPLYDSADLNGVIPADPRKSFDVRAVIARIVDGSRFDEFKALYGPTLVTGFASLKGMPIGIVANNGILFSESALKGAHFIQLCAQRGIPLLFLQVRRASAARLCCTRLPLTHSSLPPSPEHHGLYGWSQVREWGDCEGRRQARDRGGDSAGAQDHANPWGLLRRGQLRHVRPRLLAALLVHVAKRKDLRDGWRAGSERAFHHSEGQPRGEREGESTRNHAPSSKAASHSRAPFSLLLPDRRGARKRRNSSRPIRQQYEKQGSVYYSSARLWDDGIVEPASTRDVLALSFAACRNAPISVPGAKGDGHTGSPFGLFRM